MNEVRSSAPLRGLIVESVAQLQQQPTRILPDGATAYVPATTALYRLFKGLGTGFDGLTGLVVVPGDQTTNRWVQQEVAGASSWGAVEVLDEAIVTTPTGQFAWRSLGVNGGSYSLPFGSATAFVVTAGSSLLTYHGPDRNVSVNLKTTVRNDAGVMIEVHAVVSHNDDIPDGNTSEQRPAGEQGGAMANLAVTCITTERLLLLSDGDTLRIKYRNMSTADGFTVDLMTLSVVPL